MCACYCVSWYPETVFVTYSITEEAKDPRPDTFILHFHLICHNHTVRTVVMALLRFFPSPNQAATTGIH